MLNVCVLQFRVFLESVTLLGSEEGGSFRPIFLGRFEREWLHFLMDFDFLRGVAATLKKCAYKICSTAIHI